MQKIIIALLLLLLTGSVFASDNVKGYYRDSNHDGVKDTYVQPHERTSPNAVRTDNYNYPGQYNPNSGRVTPQSNSPQRTYPSNPSPYGNKGKSLY